jgi:citrate lyase beta subunit
LDRHRRGERIHIWHTPGDDRERIEEAAASTASGLTIDLEDSVHPGAKAKARATAHDFLAARQDLVGRTLVRVNQIGGPDWEADVTALCPVAETLLVPKISRVGDLQIFEERLLAAEREAAVPEGSRRIYLVVETPGLVAAIRPVLAAGGSRISGIFMGQADLTVEVGCEGVGPEGGFAPADTLLWAHGAVLFAAAEHDLPAFVSPWAPASDREARVRDMRRLFALGYDGMVIGSQQGLEDTEVARRPPAPQEEFARGVLAAFDEAAERGSGAVHFESWMMEAPHAEMARAVVRRSDR